MDREIVRPTGWVINSDTYYYESLLEITNEPIVLAHALLSRYHRLVVAQPRYLQEDTA